MKSVKYPASYIGAKINLSSRLNEGTQITVRLRNSAWNPDKKTGMSYLK